MDNGFINCHYDPSFNSVSIETRLLIYTKIYCFLFIFCLVLYKIITNRKSLIDGAQAPRQKKSEQIKKPQKSRGSSAK